MLVERGMQRETAVREGGGRWEVGGGRCGCREAKVVDVRRAGRRSWIEGRARLTVAGSEHDHGGEGPEMSRAIE